MPDVTEIQFSMTVGERTVKAVFVRREKIDDLLEDPGSLGVFLRDLLRSSTPHRDKSR